MKLITELSLEDDEQIIIGDFMHAQEMWALPQSKPSQSVLHVLTKMWSGTPLPLASYESVLTYLHSVSSDEVLHFCQDEDALMHATENFVNARGLMYEATRAIRMSQPGAMAISPGP